MERVPSYYQELGAAAYRRTASSGDQVARHLTVVDPLKKGGTELPKPKALVVMEPPNQRAVNTPTCRRQPDFDS
jgi:hypothetical protein